MTLKWVLRLVEALSRHHRHRFHAIRVTQATPYSDSEVTERCWCSATQWRLISSRIAPPRPGGA